MPGCGRFYNRADDSHGLVKIRLLMQPEFRPDCCRRQFPDTRGKKPILDPAGDPCLFQDTLEVAYQYGIITTVEFYHY